MSRIDSVLSLYRIQLKADDLSGAAYDLAKDILKEYDNSCPLEDNFNEFFTHHLEAPGIIVQWAYEYGFRSHSTYVGSIREIIDIVVKDFYYDLVESCHYYVRPS